MYRILVIDNDEATTNVLRVGLEVVGYDVKVAASAEAAFEALDAHNPDLALVELRVGDMSGLELCRRLRSRRPGLILLLSSSYHLSEGQLLRADCGASGFVPKPWNFDELAAYLREKLNSHRLTPSGHLRVAKPVRRAKL